MTAEEKVNKMKVEAKNGKAVELTFHESCAEVRERDFAVFLVQRVEDLNRWPKLTVRYSDHMDVVSFWLPKGKIPFSRFKVGISEKPGATQD
jgi:hypothetical protein